MSHTLEERAARIAAALNGLGHIAMGQSLDWARGSKGDAKLREEFHEDATVVLEVVAHEERIKSTVIPRLAECKAALVQFRELVRTIDFDDAASMARLAAHARQALESFGVPLSE